MEVPAIVTEEMRIYFKENYKNAQSLGAVLVGLKERGYSQMQSVFLLIEQLKVPFIEANSIVLNSTAWNR